MRIGVHNCVSNALDMLEFSTRSLVENAGHPFTYVVICWNSRPEIRDWLERYRQFAQRKHPEVDIRVSEYATNPHIGFVPNLRAMINMGFDRCFDLGCEYAGLVNTDQAFGPYWLQRMVPHLDPQRLVVARMVESGRMPTKHEAHDFGNTVLTEFDQGGWVQWCQTHATPGLSRITGGIGMPYFLHRDVWTTHGPWELIVQPGAAPDQKFFYATRDAGISWWRVNDALSYHIGAVERTKPDNPDFGKLPYEGTVG